MSALLTNDPRWGSWVPTALHRGFSSEYAKDWASFCEVSYQAEVLDFARMVGGKYGFDGHF